MLKIIMLFFMIVSLNAKKITPKLTILMDT